MRTGTWKGNSKGVHIWNPPDCQQGDYRKEPQRDPKQQTLQRKNRFWKIHFCPWKVEKNELNLFTVQYWTFVMSWPGCLKRPFWAENWNLKASPYLLSIPLECRSIWWTILFRNWDSKIRNTTFTCVNTYCAVWMGVNVTSLFSKARKMDLHQSHKLVSAKRKWQASNGKAVVSKFFLA